MTLQDLTLRNFRSYAKQSFTFAPTVTYIVGPNATGKTNILEAIFMLATGKSFRADVDRECIRWDTEISNVKCRMSNEHDTTELEMLMTTGEVGGRKTPLKKYLVNRVPRRQIDFVGNLRVVLFWPEHLELVTDSPSLRRRYLDSVLVQVDREYRRNILSYERALRQRNKLLDLINEGKASRSQLLFWNQLLIKSGAYMTDKRAAYIRFVNECKMLNAKCQIEYDKSVISESRLEQYKDEEVAAKATLVGPHRDDMRFLIRERSLSSFGSRGEQRLAILWLKLAELSYIENVTGVRPILLLDDIFSELDDDHKQLVMDVVANQQTIITTADPTILKEAVLKKVEVIRL